VHNEAAITFHKKPGTNRNAKAHLTNRRTDGYVPTLYLNLSSPFLEFFYSRLGKVDSRASGAIAPNSRLFNWKSSTISFFNTKLDTQQ